MNYTEAILSNSTWKLLWSEITKMLIAVKKFIYLVICYNFRHAFVAYWIIQHVSKIAKMFELVGQDS